MIKMVEIGAGSRSVGKVAESLGMYVYSIDIKPFDGIDLIKDAEYLETSDIPFVPDYVWFSPMCTSYSMAAISHHRNGQTPKTEIADKTDRVIKNVLNLISDWGCLYDIENPRAMLRKMDFMSGLPRTTITYCSYGDTRMKPTDIWSNHLYSVFNPNGWQPKSMCFNGNKNCHHEPAPRGSRTGTQGLKGNYERSKIPSKLCEEILKNVIKSMTSLPFFFSLFVQLGGGF